jgi:hypothetical protein
MSHCNLVTVKKEDQKRLRRCTDVMLLDRRLPTDRMQFRNLECPSDESAISASSASHVAVTRLSPLWLYTTRTSFQAGHYTSNDVISLTRLRFMLRGNLAKQSRLLTMRLLLWVANQTLMPITLPWALFVKARHSQLTWPRQSVSRTYN